MDDEPGSALVRPVEGQRLGRAHQLQLWILSRWPAGERPSVPGSVDETLAVIRARAVERAMRKAQDEDDVALLRDLTLLERERRENEDRASLRRLALVSGWTAYLLVVVSFVVALVLTAMGELPWPIAGTGGVILFAWTWRWIMRSAFPGPDIGSPPDEPPPEDEE